MKNFSSCIIAKPQSHKHSFICSLLQALITLAPEEEDDCQRGPPFESIGAPNGDDYEWRSVPVHSDEPYHPSIVRHVDGTATQV